MAAPAGGGGTGLNRGTLTLRPSLARAAARGPGQGVGRWPAVSQTVNDQELDSAAWNWECIRARQAQERANELKAQAQDEMAKRDQAIRDAVSLGATIRELARHTGMSRQAVYCALATEPPPRG